jgi:hypothetical protein
MGWGHHPIANAFPDDILHLMKTLNSRISLLALTLAASTAMTSCVSSPYRTSRHHGPSATVHTTYTSLPADYSGDAYYYNDRYYAGGRYEPGTYSYEGRTYNHRYFHNGKYIYGGVYRQHSPSTSYRAPVSRATSASGYVTYRSLPRDYSGDAYYYNDRYYAGGRYEPGTYSYEGRTYNNRYFHDGRYIYGGEYRRTDSDRTPAVVRRDSF